MSWEATLQINNNTDYCIDVVHNQPEGLLATIQPGEVNWNWSTNDINNTIALRFWKEPNDYFMQGSVSYGPTSGVWVDRGWMDPDAQSIRMTAYVNGFIFVQTTNGGQTVAAWNQFEQGGPINLTFVKQ